VTCVRTRAALVAAATLTGLLVAPRSAVAVSQTCQGLPATIVAASNDPTQGTEGDDVIVGHGFASIDARGGNDVICLDWGSVDAGDGNDSILVTGIDASLDTSADLGAGDDRFVGGPGSDTVDFSIDLVDVSPGADNISTGAGDDSVTSGDRGQPDRDVVDLGSGNDVTYLALPTGSSLQVQAGDGYDKMYFNGDNAAYAFDLGTGVTTRDGVGVASLPGFNEYELILNGHSEARVLGTAGPDKVYVDAERVDLHLGKGPDTAQMVNPVSGAISLGRGKDFLASWAKRLLVADLTQGRLVLENSARHRGKLALLGVETINAVAPRVVLRGGPEANKFVALGCDLRLSGGAGADHLNARSTGRPHCGALVTGGLGPDDLSGGHADDRLIGDAGNDKARGKEGIDICRAEREASCER